jgi:hypothetical protein
MKQNRRIFATFLLLLAAITVWSQSKEEKKYALRSKEVEEEVLGKADPFFSTTVVHAEYSKASAVILAKKVDLFSDLKSKVKFSLFYGKDVTNTIRYALTIREKIKIQDKNALEEYAEFSFQKIRSQSSFFKKAAYTFYGITVIKPDGSTKKINIDEEAVNAGDEDEKDKFKLAIPGLQVGDILDIYSRVEKESSSDNPVEPLDIVFGGSYPVAQYAFATKINNGFAVIYSTDNGAPEPTQKRDDEFIYLGTELKNIAQAPDDNWVYDRRELPVIKINIVPGNTAKRNKTFAPEKGQIIKGLPKEWVDGELSSKLYYAISNNTAGYERAAMAKEYIKNLKKQKGKDLDRDSLIHYLYYYGRYNYLYDYMTDSKIEIGLERNFASTNYNFYGYLIAAFNYFDIDFDILFTVTRPTGTIATAVSMDDFLFFIRAKGSTDYYLVPPSMFTIANSFPASLEGQEVYVFRSTSLRSSGAKSVIERLPTTKSTFNASLEELDIAVDKANPQLLQVKRSKAVSGNGAFDNQVTLSLFEEYVDVERTILGERLFAEEVLARVGKKRGAVLLQEYEQAYKEARKKREEYAQKEIEKSFEMKPVAFRGLKVVKQGNRHNQREFLFTEAYDVDGLVKKAGPNYLLDIGLFIGGQLQVKNEQRNRKYNIHMPYARSFSHIIRLQVPEGFTVEGTEALNRSVQNETGSFTSKAAVENGKLVIHVSKIYNRSFEPVANWSKMLEFIDAAYDFSQLKILLKKQ